MIKKNELHAFTDKDLVERMDSAKQEWMKLREKYATRQLTDTSQLRTVKRDIARLLTEQRVRRLQRAMEKIA